MKHPVYKIAAMALLCLPAFNTPVFAQQNAPTLPAPPTPPTPPTASVYASSGNTYTYKSPAYAVVANGDVMYYQGGQQDSAYRKKMQKLQEQMRDLQREMSS